MASTGAYKPDQLWAATHSQGTDTDPDASSPHRPEGAEMLDGLAGKVEAMVQWRLQCQRCLDGLAREQESLLNNVREVVVARGLRSPASTKGDKAGLRAASRDGPGGLAASLCAAKGDEDSPDFPSFSAEFERDVSGESITMSGNVSGTPTLPMRNYGVLAASTSFDFNQEGTLRLTWRSRSVDLPSRIVSFVTFLLGSKYFEPVMGLLILLNTANIGWTINRELDGEDTSTNTILEAAFLIVFALELALRFAESGRQTLKVPWNLFDFLLISVTILVMILASFDTLALRTGTLTDSMKQVLVLRILRLLRLVRAVRLMRIFRSLWKLVEGLKQCMGTMISALLLLVAALYLFACLGAEVITKTYRDDPKVGGIIKSQFADMPMIMMTLFQFISMDSAAQFYVPLVRHIPGLSVYFLFLVVVVTIALMNLITAVVVDDAISSTMMDKEMKRHFLRERIGQIKPAFQEVFDAIDVDGDGAVSISEIVEAIQNRVKIPQAVKETINIGQMLDLFEMLDKEECGELRQAEFVDGLSKLAVSEVPLETLQILHLLHSTRREVQLWRAAIESHDAGLRRSSAIGPPPRSPWPGSKSTPGMRSSSKRASVQEDPPRDPNQSWNMTL